MRLINIISCLLVLALSTPALAKEPMFSLVGKVLKVTDGDTIHIYDAGDNIKLRVRLFGIDAPETEKKNKKTGKVSKPGQPYGEEAFRVLKAKIDGKDVKIEIYDKDRYSRMVSVVWLGDRNINREMVAEGWAWAYRQYLDRPHASEYIKAEEDARKAKRGLWKLFNPMPPWEFRKRQRMEAREW
jgi:micrococcal nuclease